MNSQDNLAIDISVDSSLTKLLQLAAAADFGLMQSVQLSNMAESVRSVDEGSRNRRAPKSLPLQLSTEAVPARNIGEGSRSLLLTTKARPARSIDEGSQSLLPPWKLLEVLLEPPEALLELRLMALSELGKKAGSLVLDGSSVCVIVDVDLLSVSGRL